MGVIGRESKKRHPKRGVEDDKRKLGVVIVVVLWDAMAG